MGVGGNVRIRTGISRGVDDGHRTLCGSPPEGAATGVVEADLAVEMEVNAQLGEFTVRKNRLKSLQRSVLEMPDFNAALAATLAAHAGDRHASSLVATGGRGRRHVGAGRGSELDDTGGVDGGGADDESDASDDDEDMTAEEILARQTLLDTWKCAERKHGIVPNDSRKVFPFCIHILSVL